MTAPPAPQWIPVALGLLRDPRLQRFADHAGVTANEGLGILVRLWCLAAEYAPDGDLSGYSDAELSRTSGVAPRRRPQVVAALVEAGWLTMDRRIDGWDDRVGRHLARLHSERERAASHRATVAARGSGGAGVRVPHADGTHLHDTTRQNRKGDDTLFATGAPAPSEGGSGPGRSIWAAFDEVAGAAVTRGERGRRAAAVRDLLAAGATADSVRRACLSWARVFPDATLTETGVAAHLTRLTGEAPSSARRGRADVATLLGALDADARRY